MIPGVSCFIKKAIFNCPGYFNCALEKVSQQRHALKNATAAAAVVVHGVIDKAPAITAHRCSLSE